MQELLDSHQTKKTIGAKARVLHELATLGFPVPAFEVSPSDLNGAMERLGGPLAVRSCTTVEDGRSASFAGLFRSVLDINSPQELQSAVATCLNSIDSESVRHYLRRNGLSHHTIGMDVIVQRMVSARLSGVAFSIDPLTGEDRVVIEACEGLGDKLLSGQSQPVADDHPLLARWRPQIDKLARDVQRHYGSPQDIEFAIDDQSVWLLQARPITRIAHRTQTGVWTNADFRDGGVSASVCSPLMWSLYRRAWHDSLIGFLHEIHLLRRGNDFESARLFYGRPYWNLSAVKQCLAALPGFIERRFDEDLSVAATYEGDGLVTATTLRTVLEALPTAWKLRRFFVKQEAQVQSFLSGGFETTAARYEHQHNPGAETLRQLLKSDYWHTEILYFRTIFAASLAKLDFKDAFPDADEISLVAGIGPLRHLEPLVQIRKLRLANVDRDRAVEQLLGQFRHHQPLGLDVIHPRWDEQKTYVQRLYDNFQGSSERAQREPANHARQDYLSRLPNRRRASFIRKLDRLRTFLFLREEMRDCSSRMYYLIRRCALGIAQQRQIGDDVFFMSMDELLGDDRSGIETARDVFLRFRNFAAPNEISGGIGSGLERDFDETASLTPGRWTGIAASRGTCCGMARVVKSADEVSALPPGCVLVCPFVDPGWTCVLEHAAGVVTETGGLLSHAAVICREFGLPTVLGVKDATRWIQDGAWIEVDGDRGEVRLLPAGER